MGGGGVGRGPAWEAAHLRRQVRLWGSLCRDPGLLDTVLISVMAKNGCMFTIVGKRARKGCGRILRRIIDECDTSNTQHTTRPNVHARCVGSCRDPSMAELGLKAQPFTTRPTLPNLSVIAKVRQEIRQAKSYPKAMCGLTRALCSIAK